MKTSDFKKGNWVVYDTPNAQNELGRVKRFNEDWVFVVFHCDCEWAKFTDYTAAACHPGRLTIIN